MGHILQPQKVTKNYFQSLEKWEKDVRLWEKKFGKSLDDDLKISILLDCFSPKPLVEFANLNPERVDTYARTRKLIIDYLESEDKLLGADGGIDGGGPVPMDVDGLLLALVKGKGKGKFMKGKGKGKGGKGKGFGKGRGKGRGKGTKGRGKGG